MSIIIVNSSLDYRCGKNSTYIDFSKNGNVTNIEESNWSINTTCLLRGEPLKSSAALFKRSSAIIIIQGGEGWNSCDLHFLPFL